MLSPQNFNNKIERCFLASNATFQFKNQVSNDIKFVFINPRPATSQYLNNIYAKQPPLTPIKYIEMLEFLLLFTVYGVNGSLSAPEGVFYYQRGVYTFLDNFSLINPEKHPCLIRVVGLGLTLYNTFANEDENTKKLLLDKNINNQFYAKLLEIIEITGFDRASLSSLEAYLLFNITSSRPTASPAIRANLRDIDMIVDRKEIAASLNTPGSTPAVINKI